MLVLLIRNPSGTYWGSLRDVLREKLERGPEMSMKVEADLGLAVHWIQHPSSPPLRTTVLFDLLEMVGKV